MLQSPALVTHRLISGCHKLCRLLGKGSSPAHTRASDASTASAGSTFSQACRFTLSERDLSGGFVEPRLVMRIPTSRGRCRQTSCRLPGARDKCVSVCSMTRCCGPDWPFDTLPSAKTWSDCMLVVPSWHCCKPPKYTSHVSVRHLAYQKVPRNQTLHTKDIAYKRQSSSEMCMYRATTSHVLGPVWQLSLILQQPPAGLSMLATCRALPEPGLSQGTASAWCLQHEQPAGRQQQTGWHKRQQVCKPGPCL